MPVLLLFAILVCCCVNTFQGTSDDCPVGSFGDGCRHRCHCELDTACNRLDGSCFYGCAKPWFGLACQYRLLNGSAASSGSNEISSGSYTPASDALIPGQCTNVSMSKNATWTLDAKGDYIITNVALVIRYPNNNFDDILNRPKLTDPPPTVVQCGLTSKAALGFIESPKYPLDYTNELECAYTLQAPYGSLIKLTPEFFETEACCDKLTINDGPDMYESPLGVIAGSQFEKVVSSGSILHLVFRTDHSINKKGFRIRFEHINKFMKEMNTTVLVGPKMSPNHWTVCAAFNRDNGDKIIINCTTPIRGRFVQFSFSRQDKVSFKLCDVRIQAYTYAPNCPSGFNGPACLLQCRCMVENERCSRDGSCKSGCEKDYIGNTCEVSFRLDKMPVLEYPQDVLGSNSLILTLVTIPEWNVTADSNRGSVKVYYILEILDNAWREVNKELPERYIILRDLLPYKQYSIRVTLARETIRNSIEKGPIGPVFTFITPCNAPSKASEIVSVTSSITNPGLYPSSINMSVSWKQIPEEFLHCDGIDYSLMYRRVNETWMYTDSIRHIKNTSRIVITTVSDLKPNTVYEFVIRAIPKFSKDDSVIVTSELVESLTSDGLPGSVRNVTVQANITNARIKWQPPKYLNGNITRYKISFEELEIISCIFLEGIISTEYFSSNDVVMEGLKANRRFKMSISAVTSAGAGPAVNVTKVVTGEDYPSVKPLPPMISSILMDSARVMLFHLPCQLANSRFKHFYIITSNSTWNRTDNTRLEMLDLHNLKANSEYTVKYSWHGTIGGSPLSNETKFQTKPRDLPPVILNYISAPQKVYFEITPPVVTSTKYQYYHFVCKREKQVPIESKLLAREISGAYYVVMKGLISNKRYFCKVRNSKPEVGDWSESIDVVTTYNNTLSVRDLNVSVTDEQVSLAWKEPHIMNGILGYKISCRIGNSTGDILFKKNVFAGVTEYVHIDGGNSSYFVDVDVKCQVKTHTLNADNQAWSDVFLTDVE